MLRIVNLKLNSFKDFNNLFFYIKQNKFDTKIITFVNPFSYFKVLENKKIVRNIDYFFSDGSFLTKLNNLLFYCKIERLSFDFSSIANDVFREVELNNYSIALIGSTKYEINRAVFNIKKIYKNIDICYYRDGFFENCTTVINDLNLLKPNIIVVGMGTPKQEEFLIELKKELVYPFIGFSCGGFFTQTSKREYYYHPLIRKTGLRWLQRAISNGYVRKRLIKDYPRFLFKYIFLYINNKKQLLNSDTNL